MTVEELQACRDGYIYIHATCPQDGHHELRLFDVNEVLSGL